LDGADPQEIEDQITYPLSVQLQGFGGVKTVADSSAEPNFSMMQLSLMITPIHILRRTRILERLTIAKAAIPADCRRHLRRMRMHGQIFW